MEGLWRIYGRFMKDLSFFSVDLSVEQMHALEDLRRIYGGFMGDLWRIYGGFMQDLWRIYG